VQNGVIGSKPVTAAGVRTPGWLSPQAKAGKGLLYVADQFNQRVAIFSQAKSQDPQLLGQITDGISAPDGLAVDSKGKLYVCNFGNGTVTEYAKGKTKASTTLTQAGSPKYVSVGTDGTVYVSNFNGSSNGQLLEYPKGSKTPKTQISFASFPAGSVVDNDNNLYVAYNDDTSGDIQVLEFAPGSTQGTNLGIHVAFGYAGAMTMDNSGDLLIVNQENSAVSAFPPGATQPSKTFRFSAAYGVTLNKAANRLFVSQPFVPSVSELTYPKGMASQTYTDELSAAFGVAASPAGI
jgi:6-phosphogluconolactonase (cycloisomerase 2 family)